MGNGNTKCGCSREINKNSRPFYLKVDSSYLAALSWDSRDSESNQGNFIVTTTEKCEYSLIFHEKYCKKYNTHLQVLHRDGDGFIVSFVKLGRYKIHILSPQCTTEEHLGLHFGWKFEELPSGKVLLYNVSDKTYLDYSKRRTWPFGTTKRKNLAVELKKEYVNMSDIPKNEIISVPEYKKNFRKIWTNPPKELVENFKASSEKMARDRHMVDDEVNYFDSDGRKQTYRLSGVRMVMETFFNVVYFSFSISLFSPILSLYNTRTSRNLRRWLRKRVPLKNPLPLPEKKTIENSVHENNS